MSPLPKWLTETLNRGVRKMEIKPRRPDSDDNFIRAPFEPEQVEQLNRYQASGLMHPYTCGRRHHDGRPELVATVEGWYCPADDCDYTQAWAHTRMANKQFLDELEVSMATFRTHRHYAENDD